MRDRQPGKSRHVASNVRNRHHGDIRRGPASARDCVTIAVPMRIAMAGTGYVGLVAGAGFAHHGHEVTCVDIDAARIAQLGEGRLPIFEPGLEPLVKEGLTTGKLRFTTDVSAAVENAIVVFLAVCTPARAVGVDDSVDLQYVDAAARSVGRAIRDRTVVVIKSTVPVGTVERVRALIAGETRHPVAVVANPEFLREGAAVRDFLTPARVVLGVDDSRAEELLRGLYTPFVSTQAQILTMDVRSAELAKYGANAMLAVRISFMNELARLAERLGANIEDVRRCMGMDPRIGPHALSAGAGYGGSCLPKDVRALSRVAEDAGAPLGVVAAAAQANEDQRRLLGVRVAEHFEHDVAGRRIAVWGVAFKPETDDIREAPGVVLIDQLLAMSADVVVYDPAAVANVATRFGRRISYAPTPYQAAEGADAVVLVTEWEEFRSIDLDRISATMRTPTVFDGRNLWEPDVLRRLGFTYYGIGRGRGQPARRGEPPTTRPPRR